MKVAIVAMAALVGMVSMIAGGAVALTNVSSSSTSVAECSVSGPAGTVARYGSDQINNAAIIVAVGKQMSVSQRGWVIAVAAAMQESDLRNLSYGDRDSLGLFQERPSQGWGSPNQIMDPAYSTTQFYRHLTAVRGWSAMSVTDAAQAVERSAYPDAYAQHEQAAEVVVSAVGSGNSRAIPEDLEQFVSTCPQVSRP